MALCVARNDRGEVRIHENLDDLSTGLADYIAELSDESVKENGVFAIALFGGSFIGLLGKLCDAPYIKTVNWFKWHIFWADEQVVAKSHQDSNYRLAIDGLLTKLPLVPGHVHSIKDSVSAERAASSYEYVIRQLAKTRTINVSDISDAPRFDLIRLGMGDNGHVAALFPNHPAVEEKSDWVTFITDAPLPTPKKITFTFPVINAASNVAMIVTGEGKAEAIYLTIDGVGPDCLSSLPARRVQSANRKLVWFLDIPPASKV